MKLNPLHLVILALAFVVACLLILLLVRPVAACGPTPITEHTPSGVAGCELYGEGTASMWAGPGVARNDCVYPWDDCTPIRITVLATGAWVEVRPTMFCDCWFGGDGPNGETIRIVDLDPATVAALGLDPAQGLWDVRVEPAGGVVRKGASAHTLPDTAMQP